MDVASMTDDALGDELSEEAASADGMFDEEFDMDFDYEYDAPQYFDFTRCESSSDVEDAERWYQHAGSDPPSPFILKLKWSMEELLDVEASSNPESTDYTTTTYSESTTNPSSSILEGGSSIMASESSTLSHHGFHNSKSKSSLSRNSNLLKPTISQLAKQNHTVSARSSSGSFGSHYMKQSQSQVTSVRSSGASGRLYQIPQSFLNKSLEIEATKRQKLEKGYLTKIARLKHQSQFSHKTAKMARSTSLQKSDSRCKILTVPKEPALETAQRAHKPRPGIPHTEETSRVIHHEPFKAQPLNRKIFDAPSLPPPPKKQTPSVTEFKEFTFRTSQRATKWSAKKCTASSKVPSSKETHNIQKFQRPKPGNSTTVNKCNSTCQGQQKVPAASKGESGVVKSTKLEKIIPKEINMDMGNMHELFNKLSLNPEGTVTTTENMRGVLSVSTN